MKKITRELDYIAIFNGSIRDNLRQLGVSGRICVGLTKELGLILVGGAARTIVDNVNIGDIIHIIIMEDVHSVIHYHHPVDIVYEDEDIAVINKSPDIAVIATNSHYGCSLENALASIWGDFLYHPVNRLDRGTSGLMIVAKNCLAHSILSNDIIADNEGGKAVKREYLALVEGKLMGSGQINAPIGMPYPHTMIRGYDPVGGKAALTFYEVISQHAGMTLVRLTLATGRTHQIRVHMSHIGHPLVGDDLYGATSAGSRPMLHSHTIAFTHPITRRVVNITAPIPNDFIEIMK